MKALLKEGFPLRTLGASPFSHPRLQVTPSLEHLVTGVSLLLAPASGIDTEGKIQEPFHQDILLDDHFCSRIQEGSSLFMGTAPVALKKKLLTQGITLLEYLHVPTVATQNAVPTAEGALLLALEGLSTTLQGCRTLVTGLGRVGLTLAYRLQALHAIVWGANRSPLGRYQGESLGLKTISLEEMDPLLPGFQLIFNTIPAPIFTRWRLQELQEDVLLLDLASSPGGVDFESAREFNRQASLHLGIPGRYFPQRAGEILGSTLPGIIKERLDNMGGDG